MLREIAFSTRPRAALWNSWDTKQQGEKKMIATRFSRTISRSLLAGGALCMAFALPSAAQVQTSKTAIHGEPTHSVQVERGEVVYVSGNDVMIRGEDGELRNFNNVPDSATVNVDGQQLNVHQIKPGMKIEKQTITTTTPRVVTTVQTVTGRVWHVYTSELRYPDARRRHQPGVQHPQGSKVYDRWERNRRVWP